ncbi:MAG: hypothetical protein LBC02_04925 [Planctomycetaceae bacterium]|jgi:hypothetical protein|nr:hypothetical protein [Planctomycetaceae bacterium]
MFEELTDEQILDLKVHIREFLSGNSTVQTVTDGSGMSVTFNHQNAWKFLEELSKEQKRRKRGGNPFIALDLR